MAKNKVVAAIGVSALMLTGAIAAPAAAQGYRYHHDTNLTTSYVDSLEWRINNSPIPYGERRALLRELREIQPLAWRVETGQASRWEYNRLAAGVSRIENATRYASADDRRYRRYGYNTYRPR